MACVLGWTAKTYTASATLPITASAEHSQRAASPHTQACFQSQAARNISMWISKPDFNPGHLAAGNVLTAWAISARQKLAEQQRDGTAILCYEKDRKIVQFNGRISMDVILRSKVSESRCVHLGYCYFRMFQLEINLVICWLQLSAMAAPRRIKLQSSHMDNNTLEGLNKQLSSRATGPKGGTDLWRFDPQPDTSWSCRTMDMVPVHCTACLFTSQLKLVTKYTAWWQKQNCISSLFRSLHNGTVGGTQHLLIKTSLF